jgi:hypothetical protein
MSKWPERAMRHAGPLTIAMLAGACLCVPRPCAAEGGGAAPTWPPQVTLDGFLSTGYSYNFNRPTSGTNQFRVFDFDDNTFKIDVLELVVQKPVSRPRESGFRADLDFGSSIPRVTASAGLFRDAAGNAEDVDLQQAFASYIAPLGSGLRFDMGKFITGHGYEAIEGHDGWNDNATRSILFGYAIPFTHVGVRASYEFSSRLSGMMMVVNGWDVARDNNRSKSVGSQLTWTPTAPLTLIASGMFGPERTGNDADARELLDVVAIFKATSRLTLGANADVAAEKNVAGPQQDGRWSGIAGYARLAITGPFAVCVRGEYFDDSDGVRTGVAQSLREVTATAELRATAHFLVRADLRVDHSNLAVFQTSTGARNTQPTLLLNAIYSF